MDTKAVSGQAEGVGVDDGGVAADDAALLEPRTRWWTAEVDSPVALPSSVYDMRPSPCSSRTICRSRSSTEEDTDRVH